MTQRAHRSKRLDYITLDQNSMASRTGSSQDPLVTQQQAVINELRKQLRLVTNQRDQYRAQLQRIAELSRV